MTATITYTVLLASILLGKKVIEFVNKNFRTYP